MRILLANYRYFVSGGPERYMFNVCDALRSRGHEVVPFSIRYNRNDPTPYAEYFVNPLGSEDEVLFRDQRLTFRTTLRTLSRLFYARDVERAAIRLAQVSKADVAYVLHYLRKLSPALLVGLKRAGLPIAVRLSDYAMLCPQAHFLRGEEPCEACSGGDLLPSIRHRCVQGSLAASLLNTVATWCHRFRRFFDLIDVFVTTNPFMHQKMLAAGFPEDRLRCIPTFVDQEIFHPGRKPDGAGYVVYSGRLEAIKGVHVLLEALAILRQRRPGLKIKAKLAGSGEQSYRDRLEKMVRCLGLQDSVDFLGELTAQGLSSVVRGALLSVVPSLWYENLPNAILESYACGTPVLASELGSLVGCVDEGETGYLFQPGDALALSEDLEYCLEHPEQLAGMGRKARDVAEHRYSQANHLAALETLFENLMAECRRPDPISAAAR